MRNIPAPTPAAPAAAPDTSAAPATPAPKTPVPNGGLPDAVKVDNNYDAGSFFEAHQSANPGPGKPSAAPAAAAPVVPAAPAATPEPQAPAEAPKGSLAAKLAAKVKPVAPAAAAAPDGQPAAKPADGAAQNPEDLVQLDHKYSSNAREAFDHIKGIAKGLRDQLTQARGAEAQLKADLEAARKGPAPVETQELERLRAEHKTMSDRLALVDLREHPDFQAKVLEPQKSALAEAKAILEANALNVDLDGLLRRSKPEFLKALGEATKTLSVAEQVEVSNHMRTAYGLHQQGEAMLGKARETYGSLRQQTVEGQRQAFSRTWDQVMPQVGEHLVEIDLPDNATPAQREAVENYNAGIKSLRQSAEKIAFDSAGPEHVSRNAIKAAAYDFHINQAMPRLMGEFQALLNQNRDLAGQLKAVRDRNPNLSGNAPASAARGATPNPADGTDPRNMSHADAAAHFYRPPAAP